MANKPAIFPRSAVMAFLTLLAAASTLEECLAIIEAQIDRFPQDRPGAKSKTWRAAFRHLVDGLRDNGVPYNIFRPGNTKLPFWCFSVVPIFTCPGRGECEQFCYSLKAWQYPSALARQIQNWLLLRFRRRAVADAFFEIPQGHTIRLYVDGDFASMADLAFWFRLLFARPDIDVDTNDTYGYSKSLHLFDQWAAQGLPFPPQYRLNLSDGSRFDGTELFERVGALPVVRGIFAAVPLAKNYGTNKAKMESREYHAAVRQAIIDRFGRRGVSCQIKCDSGACAERHWCHHLSARNHQPAVHWPESLIPAPADVSPESIDIDFTAVRGTVDYSEPGCTLADKPIIGIGIH